MAWQKGQSGNPGGRQAMPLGESLAVAIRKSFSREQRAQALQHVVEYVTAPESDPIVRLKALDYLSKYGWPEEKSGSLALRVMGKNAQVVVNHVHQPIGITATTADDGALPGYAGVKLGNAQHVIESAPVEEPIQAPAGDSSDGGPDPLA